jgi:hypothetical protein
MLSLVLFGVAFAECGLSTDLDPSGACALDSNGFPSMDADVDGVFSLTISTKGANTDTFNVEHPATVGALTDDTATDGRYILACKQVAGLKTVKMTISRPASMTAFGGEWVQLFPKDSWANVTNEYEPFTFNDFGAKIPLPEFRPTPTGTEAGGSGIGLTTEAVIEDTMNVFMEVSEEGDYEVMYGNPSLVTGGYWVAVQFRSTILRVGTPWAECAGDALSDASYSVGSIMPILFGGPNLNSIALLAGNPSYLDVISELSGVTVPVKVVLEIFSASLTSYTDSTESYGVCYKAGNACPEAHLVCKAEYCEMDVWKQLIADFKAAGSVTVLGSVDSAATLALYDGLDVDGFYFTDGILSASGTSVSALGSPLFASGEVADADVYVTLAAKELGVWNPFSWYPYVPPAKWAAIVTEATDVSAVATLVDRGYGWVYVTSEAGFEAKSTIDMSALLSAIETPTTRRKLQERNLEASAPFWGCDDTLFECKPICMKKMGVTTTKVSDSLCSAAPMDQCTCKCFHEAQWTCEGESVVCKAKFGAGELKTVGDKVCETRGATKPASIAELRVASVCEPVTEMRGSAPTAQCLAQWGTPAPVEEKPNTPAPGSRPGIDSPLPAEVTVPVIEESFASTLALAALALYA